jgi:hypothetical protein
VQYEALSLVLRFLRASDVGVEAVRENPRTLRLLEQIKSMGDGIPDDLNTLGAKDLPMILKDTAIDKRLYNTTVILDSSDLKPYEMVRLYMKSSMHSS